MSKLLQTPELGKKIAQTMREAVAEYAETLRLHRERELGLLNKSELAKSDLCPLCGNEDKPGSCTCLSMKKDMGGMGGDCGPGMMKGELAKAAMAMKPQPSSHSEKANSASIVANTTNSPKAHTNAAGLHDVAMQYHQSLGNVAKFNAHAAAKNAHLKASKVVILSAPAPSPAAPMAKAESEEYGTHAAAAMKLTNGMGVHSTAADHTAASTAHALAAKHASTAPMKSIHLMASKVHKDVAANMASQSPMIKEELPSMKGFTSDASNPTAMPGNVKPNKPAPAPMVKEELPSMKGFKSVASNPTAMPGNVKPNKPAPAPMKKEELCKSCGKTHELDKCGDVKPMEKKLDLWTPETEGKPPRVLNSNIPAPQPKRSAANIRGADPEKVKTPVMGLKKDATDIAFGMKSAKSPMKSPGNPGMVPAGGAIPASPPPAPKGPGGMHPSIYAAIQSAKQMQAKKAHASLAGAAHNGGDKAVSAGVKTVVGDYNAPTVPAVPQGKIPQNERKIGGDEILAARAAAAGQKAPAPQGAMPTGLAQEQALAAGGPPTVTPGRKLGGDEILAARAAQAKQESSTTAAPFAAEQAFQNDQADAGNLAADKKAGGVGWLNALVSKMKGSGNALWSEMAGANATPQRAASRIGAGVSALRRSEDLNEIVEALSKSLGNCPFCNHTEHLGDCK